MQINFPDLEWWDEKVPIFKNFDDPYYSIENGFDETRHVFLEANNIPGRFYNGFQVAELGFGTGLNFLTTFLSQSLEPNKSLTSLLSSIAPLKSPSLNFLSLDLVSLRTFSRHNLTEFSIF